MKRLFCAFITLALCASLIACTVSNHTEDTVTFYYCTDSEDYEKTLCAFSPESRQASAYASDMHKLLQLYLAGPISANLISPFPKDLTLEDLTISSKNTQITLSSNFSSVMDMDMTLECACLTMTVLDLVDTESVTIRTINHYGAVQTVVTMSQETLLLLDAAEPQKGN